MDERNIFPAGNDSPTSSEEPTDSRTPKRFDMTRWPLPEKQDPSGSSEETAESARNLDEIFRCFICFNRVENAHMCPHCSKLCCEGCIKRWLLEQKPHCPHCRSSLRVGQLVNCRFAGEITAELDRITNRVQGKPDETCPTHATPMAYYCITCTTAICSDCAMFDDKHRNHQFEHLSTVYDSHVDAIKSEAAGLRHRMKELRSLLSAVENNVERVRKSKEERALELRQAVEQMQARLDAQLKAKLLTLLAQKGSIAEEIELLDSAFHELNNQLANNPKSELISKSSELTRMLQEIHRKPTSHFSKAPVPADFASEIVPRYDCGVFRLKSFSKVAKTTELVYSDPLCASGLTWRLKVYPNGNGIAQETYLSVFLEMVKGLPETSKYEYRIEMVNHMNPSQCVVREFASDFEVGECWGYNRFYRIDLLEREGYLLPDDDTIVLRFYVRAPTYFQQCRDQRRYIEQLEVSNAQLRQQLSEIKQSTHGSQRIHHISPSKHSSSRQAPIKGDSVFTDSNIRAGTYDADGKTQSSGEDGTDTDEEETTANVTSSRNSATRKDDDCTQNSEAGSSGEDDDTTSHTANPRISSVSGGNVAWGENPPHQSSTIDPPSLPLIKSTDSSSGLPTPLVGDQTPAHTSSSILWTHVPQTQDPPSQGMELLNAPPNDSLGRNEAFTPPASVTNGMMTTTYEPRMNPREGDSPMPPLATGSSLYTGRKPWTNMPETSSDVDDDVDAEVENNKGSTTDDGEDNRQSEPSCTRNPQAHSTSNKAPTIQRTMNQTSSQIQDQPNQTSPWWSPDGNKGAFSSATPSPGASPQTGQRAVHRNLGHLWCDFEGSETSTAGSETESDPDSTQAASETGPVNHQPISRQPGASPLQQYVSNWKQEHEDGAKPTSSTRSNESDQSSLDKK
eukprot:GFYU01004062.1.p1 GENE.GFYU01004062.1~~GFYU01004062.1.p1  ORF type:complete len:906 (-),score=50.70 GFYU01004062.1:160-2877(-)